jgi:hypothetical protein
MDIEDRDIIIQGSNITRLSRKQVWYTSLNVSFTFEHCTSLLLHRRTWVVLW